MVVAQFKLSHYQSDSTPDARTRGHNRSARIAAYGQAAAACPASKKTTKGRAVKDVRVIEVRVWGQRVGAVAFDARLGYYAFAYEPAWRRAGIELAPLTLPLGDRGATFVFPNLPDATFHHLPGMLADALPDAFGNALIDACMAQRGMAKSEVTPLDRLAHMGKRGMGALEFKPA